MIITLNGREGSGKSTVARMLAEQLNLKRYYIGGMRREAARKRGMTLEEFNTWSEAHPEGDKEFDDFVTKVGKTEDNFIIESRTAFHFIPHSIKIYLDVDLDVAAKRIFSHKKLKERNERSDIGSPEEIKKGLRERARSDIARYKKYYDLDIHQPKNYDLVVDTNNKSAEAVLREIVSFLEDKGYLTAD